MRHIFLRFCLLCFFFLCFSGSSYALFVPSLMFGGNAVLNPKTDNIPGARGSLTQVKLGWLWEKQGKDIAIGVFLPVETDFRARFATGFQFLTEFWGSLRVFIAPMLDLGQPYSFFFIRGGVSLGWRNTGSRPKPASFPAEGGVYFWLAVDYRVPNTDHMLPQNIRLLWGLRIEIGISTSKEREENG